MANIYYINSIGQKLELDGAVYRLQKNTTLFDNTWNYSANDYVSKVESFDHTFAQKEFTLGIYARERKNFGEAINKLHNVFEYDVRKKSPGRLYFGDFFMRGYVIESKQAEFLFGMNIAYKSFVFLSESGDWIKETSYSFTKKGDAPAEAEYLDYPYDFKHDLLNGSITKRIENGSATDADFRMTIWGACTNPTVFINDWEYTVNVDVELGEYLVIDSLEKTIIKKNKDTSETNCFSLRNKDSYIFKKLDVGINNLVRPVNFGVDLIVYEYRSEPIWWT